MGEREVREESKRGNVSEMKGEKRGG